MMGQFADETHRITEEYVVVLVQLQLPGGSIEGSEETVVHEDVGTGQGIHQGRLAGVGIAHQGYTEGVPASVALSSALRGDVFQLAFELTDARPNEATIRFDLGLAGAAPSADAAHLSLQVGPLPGQPGEQVLQLCQLYLGLGLPGSGVPGEDIDDKPTAVNDLDAVPGCALEVLLLRGGQVVIEDNQVTPQFIGLPHEGFGFALADEGGGIGADPGLHNLSHYLSAGGFGQQAQLRQVFAHSLGRCAAPTHAYQNGVLFRDVQAPAVLSARTPGRVFVVNGIHFQISFPGPAGQSTGTAMAATAPFQNVLAESAPPPSHFRQG
ncbi:hypothetical protein ES703_104346 [subsurface metagenome]